MKQLLSLAALIVTLPPSSFAQDVEPLPASSDVVLELTTVGDQLQFHPGELIPVRLSYTARTSGKYIWVSNDTKLVGGRPLLISCSPTVGTGNPRPASTDPVTFETILIAPCGGVGGSIGGVSGGSDWKAALTADPLSFVLPLHLFARFRIAGAYTCAAQSADITAATSDQSSQPAMLVKSNLITLNIIDDPAWSQSALANYSGSYDEKCRGDDVAEKRSLPCFDIAQRITYLDTVESLALEVNAFAGRDHGWDNGFWEAIRHSSYPEEAVQLLTSRMQEPNFQVTTDVLDWLASSDLRIEAPEAFRTDTPTNYHAQAVEKLRKYVRSLGESLRRKNADALQESAKTYQYFAEQDYCEGHPLVPTEEQNHLLAAVGIHSRE